MNNTIEERAKEASDKLWNVDWNKVDCSMVGFVSAVTPIIEDAIKEQKAIDIDEACDAVFSILMSTTHLLGNECKMVSNLLRKSMEG